MITCHRKFLEDRCKQRGYSLAEVMPCVIQQNGDQWTIDENHPKYPRTPKTQAHVTEGAGTELKKLLSRIGITAKPNCSCNRRAKTMDENGIEWCERNIEVIVGWLKEEATRRRLPFVEAAGRMIVRMAIKNARKRAGGVNK